MAVGHGTLPWLSYLEGRGFQVAQLHHIATHADRSKETTGKLPAVVTKYSNCHHLTAANINPLM